MVMLYLGDSANELTVRRSFIVCLKFDYVFFQENEVKLQLQSVRLAMGGALMKEGKLFDAMEQFEQVKTPPGLYNLAQVKL